MSIETERFTACWRADAPRVLAFARRHVGSDDAPDVVADVFLTAWGRWRDVPDPAIPWLLVAARHQIANRRRAARRRLALTERVALLDAVAADGADAADAAVARGDALERLARLGEDHREALLLVSWDGLTSDQAALVLGIRPAAFRRRVSRARAALAATDRATPSPGPRGASLPALPHLVATEDLR